MKLPWNKEEKGDDYPPVPDILAQAQEVATKAVTRCGLESCSADGYYGVQIVSGMNEQEADCQQGYTCREHINNLLESLDENGGPYLFLMSPIRFGSFVQVSSMNQVDPRDPPSYA